MDLTIGPDARGAFLVVRYHHIRCGEEERYADATGAVQALEAEMGERFAPAVSAALVATFGAEERGHPREEREAQEREMGRRMREFAASRPPLRGPLFGPGFGPFGRW